MAVQRKEYLLTVDDFNRPTILNDQQAIAVLLMRLILLKPGSDPLHPEMGIGIQNYRYALNRLEELKQRITNQINTYIPEHSLNSVEIKEISAKKICNIEITIDHVAYIYDSETAKNPVTLNDIK